MSIPRRLKNSPIPLYALVFCCSTLLLGCIGPSIRSLTPSSGLPGTTVTIGGGQFGKLQTVDFAGVPAQVLSATGTEITVVVPHGAKTGLVNVQTADGSVSSPYPFTVPKAPYQEKETNDTFALADNAGLSDRLTGNLVTSDEDWFRIRSGPASGPWAYTLELHATETGLPLGTKLRIELVDPANVSMTTSDGNDQTTWVVLPPNADVFVHVSWVGSTTATIVATYAIDIARIPVTDVQEPDDNLLTAQKLPFAGGVGSSRGSYLCNRYEYNSSTFSVGFTDVFRIPPLNTGQNVSVVVLDAGLKGKNNVIYIHLYNADGDYVTYDFGGANTATLNYTVQSYDMPTQNKGDWFVEITNPWDYDDYAGNGSAPASCKMPYGILVGSQ